MCNWYFSDYFCWFCFMMFTQVLIEKLARIHTEYHNIFKPLKIICIPLALYLNVWIKARFFLVTLTWQTQFTFNMCMKTVNDLCVFLTGFILCLKNILPIPYSFIKIIYLEQSFCILDSTWFNNYYRLYQRIRPRLLLFIWSGKRSLPFKLFTTYSQEKCNLKENHACLTDSQYSRCLLKKAFTAFRASIAFIT